MTGTAMHLRHYSHGCFRWTAESQRIARRRFFNPSSRALEVDRPFFPCCHNQLFLGVRCTSTSTTNTSSSAFSTRSGFQPLIHNEAAIDKQQTQTKPCGRGEQCSEHAAATVGGGRALGREGYLKALSDLSKLRLSALVVATTSAGFLAAGGPVCYPTLLAACAGTALCSSSASTFNQVFEVERDRRMKRTRNRPLPRGVVTPASAALLGVATGTCGGAVLALGTGDCATTLLGVGNIALYAGLYTYLKPRSELNTWVGAVVGAVPPVMGWTAAGGSPLDPEALMLGSMLYLWQLPHFWALSWMHRVDYARGGFEMVPCNDPNGDRTARLILDYAWYLSAVPLASSVIGVTSSMFAIEGIALNAYAIHVARQFDRDRTNANARKVFLTSLWYLPCLMTLFVLHSKTWEEEKEGDEIEAEIAIDHDGSSPLVLRDVIQAIRRKGREMCIHEIAVADSPSALFWFLAEDEEQEVQRRGDRPQQAEKCPIVFGKEKVRVASASGIGAAEAVVATGGASVSEVQGTK